MDKILVREWFRYADLDLTSAERSTTNLPRQGWR